jgi:hypothetical protein
MARNEDTVTRAQDVALIDMLSISGEDFARRMEQYRRREQLLLDLYQDHLRHKARTSRSGRTLPPESSRRQRLRYYEADMGVQLRDNTGRVSEVYR